ncbi:MAG: hypothetical protein MNPFHGCM_02600 [Gemmatimonadaceae bacterium]|nr:hypothetical protein [Gemmatimonadaceae bacterium]
MISNSRVVAVVVLPCIVGALRAQQPIPNLAGRVMTVSGPVAPDRLGHTLMHEHIFVDLTLPDDQPERWAAAGRQRPAGATAARLYHQPLTLDIVSSVMLGAINRDNWLLTDESEQAREIAEFKRAGGGTIVDATSMGIDRRPEALQRVAQASGLNVVMGTGWYAAGWYPKDLDRRTVESLTDEIVRDLTVGVGGTGIRAGIIGELGTSANPGAGIENRILRASGRASRLTGAAITLHSTEAARQHARILDILVAEGADPSRVILGHADYLAGDLTYITPLLERGATIEFDLLGKPPLVTRKWPIDSEVAKTIVALTKAGYADRIVLSQDVSAKMSLKSYGGTGYSFIEEQFLPYLKRQGITDAQIARIMVENPKRLLTFVAPRS